MLTHVHKVIHKVVGIFARVLRGREKWRLPLPPAEFGEETEAKKVTRSDQTLASGAPGRPVSLGRGACAKGFSERTLAVVHRRVRCMAGRQRMQATGRMSSVSGANDVSAWRGRVITEHWGASDRPPADASGACFRSLVPYWSRPNANRLASGASLLRIRCICVRKRDIS
jgi:hypothetical protein